MSDVQTQTLNDEMANDEMPVAPATEGSSDTPAVQVEISGEMSAGVVEKGIDLGEPVPAGVYRIRLEKYEIRGKVNDDGLGPDPYFNCEFEVIDPPKFAGRKLFDNVTWMRDVDVKRAEAGDPVAEKKAADRMGKIKQLQHCSGFEPKGNYNVKRDFLDKKPECKAQVEVRQRMKKNDKTGKYDIPVHGQMDNNIKKYLPLLNK